MSNKIESTVILKCAPNKIEEFKIAVAELIKETVKEPGCELFRIFQNNEKPDEFILWEIFTNEWAMQEHMKKEHEKKYFALGLFEPLSAIHHSEIN
ncbi:putative quinol monooxygenase [Dysgonomonas sp. ZJ709]|uniref:putative quinol monooxygenase n=1 Tax=Dysgonomonas sp. ZJ709 TaxID=2709797 RepID=UPI0013ECB3AD|nr:putative quinol monooxygenase [Dysgonomonas sp. ZJ709]